MSNNDYNEPKCLIVERKQCFKCNDVFCTKYIYKCQNKTLHCINCSSGICLLCCTKCLKCGNFICINCFENNYNEFSEYGFKKCFKCWLNKREKIINILLHRKNMELNLKNNILSFLITRNE